MKKNINAPAVLPVSSFDPKQYAHGSFTPELESIPNQTSSSQEALSSSTVADSPHALDASSPEFPPATSDKAGKGGKAGDIHLTNAEFVATIFPQLPADAFAAVCSKFGDPTAGGWPAQPGKLIDSQCRPNKNNYINCSSFYLAEDGSFKARKERFAACHFLLLDDLGHKASMERLAEFELSWLIETSPGNFQGGIILAEPITEGKKATSLLDALIAAGLCDPGASGPLSRWARLPVAINGKPKYADKDGKPFQCKVNQWNPTKRYTPEEIVKALQLPAAPPAKKKMVEVRLQRDIESVSDDVYQPRTEENPVVMALKAHGLYKSSLGSGKHDITCPWVQEHTDALDSGAAYFEPSEVSAIGGFCCQHSHRNNYHIRELLNHLDISNIVARHKSVIRIVSGDLNRVVDAAERELANLGLYYQSGGLIVTVSTDPVTGDPLLSPLNALSLTRALADAAIWEKFDGRSSIWVRSDPPPRHVSVLYDANQFRHLPPLSGVARQPYFRESDGVLIMQAGYDRTSQRYGVFDSQQFSIPDATQENAVKALAALEDLLVEFHFLAPTDKAAALSAIFTAVVRPTLAYAPGFHARAPVMGSGKTYLCELIGAFAGPSGSAKVSYPKTSEEATKVMLSLLLTGPAVIEFDDMDTDWIPHGTIKRMLTAEQITDRILGISKTATVSTRTLLLASGNNVGPIRDLLRRVLTIHIDPRCATPATMSYKGNPVERVRKHRARYVAAVLTIILAWRNAGSPKADVDSIATFNGAWSDYCRHTLLWLGHPDPASALLHQVRHDPDTETLKGLMSAWHSTFGATAVTVRKAVEAAHDIHPELLDAMREFPVEEHGVINRSKLGWILKKNANRIVDGYEFQRAEADGRTAWRVASVTPPAEAAGSTSTPSHTD